jgi:trehalose synthase-fused probable maltokinase
VERVQLFRATASVMARRLAGFLAAAPCHLSLPVIRQIQHVMLPMSEQIHVAEIFLSALLQRLTPDRSGLDPDMVQYDFLPGVRLELLNGVPRTEALQVVDKVTEFINECAGQASDFFVLLPDADAPQGVAFPADSRAFASLKAQVLRRFGDEFARLADELERQATTAAQAGVEEPQPVTPTSDKAAYSATVEPSTVTPPLSDPVQALLDLRLPQSLIALLAPILESLGYSIEQAETTRSEAGGYRLYTLVTNGVTRRPLLYIPMWILNDASRPNPMAVDSMIYAFDSGAMLYIVSEGLDTPAWAFRHMFAEVWLQKQQIKAIFVPWRDIEHLASIGPNAQRVEIKNLFDLEEEAPGLIEEEAPGLIPVTGAWTSIFYGQAKVDLQTLLPGYLQRRRWFGGKGRTIRSAVIQETIPIPQRSPMGYISLIQVDYTEGSPEIYALPLTFASDKSADWVRMAFPEAVVARLQVARPAVEGVLYDALYDRAFALELLDAMAKHQRFTGVSGDIVASSVASSTFFRPPWRSRRRDASLKPYILPAELAHTRVIYGNKFFLKCFRLLQDGVSPDLEIGRFLTKHKFAYSPPLAGAIEYHRQVGAPVTLAMLQGFVAHQEDAWQYTLSALRDFFEQILAGQAESERATIPRQLLLGLSAAAIPPFVGEFIGTYLEAARLLGQRTAELHIALASAPDDPNFAPEPFSMSYQRSIYQTIQSQASQVFQLLRDSLQVLPDVREEAQKVLELESEVQRRLQLLLQHQIDTTRIRLHGDYHLGQVLYTGSDFVIIDFEGEPPRPLSERRLKHSPLRDVASMLTSFHYASYAALFDTEGVGRREDFAALEPWVRFWQYWVSTAFLQSYLATASGLPPLLPQSQEALQVLLEAYLLEKSIYALGYELYNRPTWVWVPIEGILQLLDQSDAPSGRRGIRRSGQSQSAGPGTSGRDRVRRRR